MINNTIVTDTSVTLIEIQQCRKILQNEIFKYERILKALNNAESLLIKKNEAIFALSNELKQFELL